MHENFCDSLHKAPALHLSLFATNKPRTISEHGMCEWTLTCIFHIRQVLTSTFSRYQKTLYFEHEQRKDVKKSKRIMANTCKCESIFVRVLSRQYSLRIFVFGYLDEKQVKRRFKEHP